MFFYDDDGDEATATTTTTMTTITEEGRGNLLHHHRYLPLVDFESGDDDDDIITTNNNKGLPILRTWELNDNSTRWDKLLAAPSDSTLIKYWWSWTIIALLVGIFSLVVFCSILSSKKARTNPFNVYLLYTLIPDFTFSLLCGTTCLINATTGSYYSNWMCNFQQFYVVFGIGGNAWMNAVITWQLHKMLQFSNQRRRYISPTCKQVSIQAIVVYIYVCSLGILGLIGGGGDNTTTSTTTTTTNWPFQSGPPSGLACIPIESNIRSSYAFWFVFFPLFAGIPLIYVTYAAIDVWRRKLLPPTGKRRLLTVYFGRLIFVFWIMWLPTLILIFLFSTFVEPWAHFMGGTWSHLQGAVSAGVSLLKPDIMLSFQNFIFCRYCTHDIDNRINRRSPHVQSDDEETQHHHHQQQRRRRSFMFGSTSFFMAKTTILRGSNNGSGHGQQQQGEDSNKQGSTAQLSAGDIEEDTFSHSSPIIQRRRSSSCRNENSSSSGSSIRILMDSIPEDSDNGCCDINDNRDGTNEDLNAISTRKQQQHKHKQEEIMTLEQAIAITATTDSDRQQLLLLQKDDDEQEGESNHNAATRNPATCLVERLPLQEATDAAAAIDAIDSIEEGHGIRRQQLVPNIADTNATDAIDDDYGKCCGGQLPSAEVATAKLDDNDAFSLEDTGF